MQVVSEHFSIVSSHIQSQQLSFSITSILLHIYLQACEDTSLEAFAKACADFGLITPLDPWKTSMLLKAKKFIADMAGEDGDGVDLT